MRRTDGRWFVIIRDEPIEPAEIVARLTELLRDRRIGGPLFGQQLIGAGRDNALPTEVRVFGFYGEVGMVNIRRATSHGDNAGTRVRRFLEDGTPGPRHPLHDDDIGLPDIFEAAVEIGRRFSTRVPRPGGPHYFGPEDDLRLGELWERAQARVLNDVIDGSDYSLKFGEGPHELTIGNRRYVPDQGWAWA